MIAHDMRSYESLEAWGVMAMGAPVCQYGFLRTNQPKNLKKNKEKEKVMGFDWLFLRGLIHPM